VDLLEDVRRRELEHGPRAADVHALELGVREEQVDVRAGVVDHVHLGGEPRVCVVGEPEARLSEIAPHDGDALGQVVPFDPAAAQARLQPLPSLRVARRAHEAVDVRLALLEDLLQQERAEVARDAGEQHLAVSPAGARRQLADRDARCRRRAVAVRLRLGCLDGRCKPRDGRIGVQQAQRELDSEGLPEAQDGLGGLERAAAEGEEAVLRADLLALQDFGEDGRDLALGVGGRRDVLDLGLDLLLLLGRGRKGGAVDLAHGGEREVLELDEAARDHVVRQLLAEEGTQGGRVELPVPGDDVPHQLLRRLALDAHRRRRDVRV
jgi:hypothetical protein